MWLHNLGCEEARYLDTWQSSDPGISNIPTALFRLPPVTVAAALGIDLATAEVIRTTIPCIMFPFMFALPLVVP